MLDLLAEGAAEWLGPGALAPRALTLVPSALMLAPRALALAASAAALVGSSEQSLPPLPLLLLLVLVLLLLLQMEELPLAPVEALTAYAGAMLTLEEVLDIGCILPAAAMEAPPELLEELEEVEGAEPIA